MLTLDLSKPSTRSAATPTTEKASLNSQRAISSLVTPAFLRARGTARVGAVGKSMGAQAASAKPFSGFMLVDRYKKNKGGHFDKHTENLGKRLQAFLLHNLARGQDDGGSTVVEGGRVGRGNGPVLLDKHRPDCPKLVLQKLLVLFILLDDDISLSALDGDGRNLIGKRVGGPCFLGTGVRRETKVVLVFTRDLELGGGVFGAVAHGELVVHVKETVDDKRVLGLKVAERGGLAGHKEAGLQFLAKRLGFASLCL